MESPYGNRVILPIYSLALWSKMLLHSSMLMLVAFLACFFLKVIREYRKKAESSPLMKLMALKFGTGYAMNEFYLRKYRIFRHQLNRPDTPTDQQLKEAYREHCTSFRKEFLLKAKYPGEKDRSLLNDLTYSLVDDLTMVAKRPAHWVPQVRAMAKTGLLKMIGMLMHDEYEEDDEKAILVLPKWAKFRLADMLDEVYRLIPMLSGNASARRAFQKALNTHANPYTFYVDYFTGPQALENENGENEDEGEEIENQEDEEEEVPMMEETEMTGDEEEDEEEEDEEKDEKKMVHKSKIKSANQKQSNRDRDWFPFILKLFIISFDTIVYLIGAFFALFFYMVISEAARKPGPVLTFDAFIGNLLANFGFRNATDFANVRGGVVTGLPSLAA